VKAALEFGADFVLAVGGGSAIDAAKAIAHGAANPGVDIWRYWLKEVMVEKTLPVGVVLTISAAGSETSWSAVLTNTETGTKRGLSTDFNRPVFAVMNPELTYSLPKFQIACGVADILMHTLDRYFSVESTAGTANEITDAFAEGLMRVVIKNGTIALDEPSNYQAQSELMWAGSLSHNGITGLGNTHDFSVHQLGHELSARFDVTHGASLTCVWGAWARYVLQVNPSRFARLATNIWQIVVLAEPFSDHVNTGLAGISAMEEYFESLGLPTCFSQLGIGVQTDEVLRELAFGCVHEGKRLVGSFRPLNQDDVFEIYKAVNR
jgi:alcohol dehydrogenase YqhD (iron-dependent ADH family)